MTGIVELDQLLDNMKPQLSKDEYVFCTIPVFDFDSIKRLSPISLFHEDEGTSFVLEKQSAIEAGIAFEESFKKITLQVHSSLEAVGLTAAISAALTKEGISANVIAAYYHDHIFIPSHKADIAIRALEDLSRG